MSIDTPRWARKPKLPPRYPEGSEILATDQGWVVRFPDGRRDEVLVRIKKLDTKLKELEGSVVEEKAPEPLTEVVEQDEDKELLQDSPVKEEKPKRKKPGPKPGAKKKSKKAK